MLVGSMETVPKKVFAYKQSPIASMVAHDPPPYTWMCVQSVPYKFPCYHVITVIKHVRSQMILHLMASQWKTPLCAESGITAGDVISGVILSRYDTTAEGMWITSTWKEANIRDQYVCIWHQLKRLRENGNFYVKDFHNYNRNIYHRSGNCDTVYITKQFW